MRLSFGDQISFISVHLDESSSNELYLSEVALLIALPLMFCDFIYPTTIQPSTIKF